MYQGIGDKMTTKKFCLEEKWEFDGRSRDYRMICVNLQGHKGNHLFEYNGQFIRH